LDWLKAQYPALSQNELMFEMQGIRMLHCTIWVGGVREIVARWKSTGLMGPVPLIESSADAWSTRWRT
jgi:hypothetical protein